MNFETKYLSPIMCAYLFAAHSTFVAVLVVASPSNPYSNLMDAFHSFFDMVL